MYMQREYKFILEFSKVAPPGPKCMGYALLVKIKTTTKQYKYFTKTHLFSEAFDIFSLLEFQNIKYLDSTY